MANELTQISESLRTRMELIHLAREKALANGRKIIQVSSKAIKHLHRRQHEEADALIAQGESLVAEALTSVQSHPSIRYAPYLQDSIKEYVEAVALRSIILQSQLPTPETLQVEPPTYLNGLCEAASECRRYALDELRQGRPDVARRLAESMEDIYDELVTFDYPDAVTGNLRRNVDALRAVLERTQSDLSVAGMQLELIDELRKSRQ